MNMKVNIADTAVQHDRRKNQDRRRVDCRRVTDERRHDHRERPVGQRKSLRVWLRSVTKARLGVDRRKSDRRTNVDRRQPCIGGILTQDEISDLLSL